MSPRQTDVPAQRLSRRLDGLVERHGQTVTHADASQVRLTGRDRAEPGCGLGVRSAACVGGGAVTQPSPPRSPPGRRT